MLDEMFARRGPHVKGPFSAFKLDGHRCDTVSGWGLRSATGLNVAGALRGQDGAPCLLDKAAAEDAAARLNGA